MAWIVATTLDRKNANLNTRLIAAILDRVRGNPAEGSVIILASGDRVEVVESPAELIREIEIGEHPENPPARPDVL